MAEYMTTMSPDLNRLVKTGIDELTSDAIHRAGAANRDRWEDFIDSPLVVWGKDPSCLQDDEEGIIAPTREAVNRACVLAIKMRDQDAPPPTRVVPDGEGGISFERRLGDVFQSMDVSGDGSVELVTFHDCRLVSRIRLP